MDTRRSKSLKPHATPDQLAEGIKQAVQSLKQSEGAAQSPPGSVADMLGDEDTTTSEIGETEQSASEVITQSPVLTELEVLMQTLFPGGVTVVGGQENPG